MSFDWIFVHKDSNLKTSERIWPQCVAQLRETFSSCVPGRRNIAIEGLLHRWHRLSKDINFYVRPNKIMKAKKKPWIAGLCNCLPLLNAIESAKVHSFCKQFCLRILFSKTDSWFQLWLAWKGWWGGSFFHKLKIVQTLFKKWMAFTKNFNPTTAEYYRKNA